MLAIEFQDLFYTFQGTTLLSDVSLQVTQGEFVIFFGPNGGGKTTLLRLLMGFLEPSQGYITLFGGAPKSGLQRIGYVPQNLPFDRQFPLSLLELVLMGRLRTLPWYGRFSLKEKREAREILEKVGLGGMEGKAFGRLSGGEMQRALFARALFAQPELLLLDEPTASVDVAAEETIYALLKELKGKVTIIMVTHQLEKGLKMADALFCVRHTVFPVAPQEVCAHFVLGLYHPVQGK